MIQLLYQLWEIIFMIGKQDGQTYLLNLDIDSMIPDDYFLRQIKDSVNFNFIYERGSPYYSYVGRKTIDLVILVKSC